VAKVLVIDDDPAVRDVIARVVRREGHTVREAENGKDALRQFADDPADLVISDIYMPEMDGIELLRRFRETSPETRLVAISGGGAIAAHHLLSAAKALGAVAVIEKPFDLADLREQLAGLEPTDPAS